MFFFCKLLATFNMTTPCTTYWFTVLICGPLCLDKSIPKHQIHLWPILLTHTLFSSLASHPHSCQSWAKSTSCLHEIRMPPTLGNMDLCGEWILHKIIIFFYLLYYCIITVVLAEKFVTVFAIGVAGKSIIADQEYALFSFIHSHILKIEVLWTIHTCTVLAYQYIEDLQHNAVPIVTCWQHRLFAHLPTWAAHHSASCCSIFSHQDLWGQSTWKYRDVYLFKITCFSPFT